MNVAIIPFFKNSAPLSVNRRFVSRSAPVPIDRSQSGGVRRSRSHNCRDNASGARRSSQLSGDQSSARLRARGQPVSVRRSRQGETYSRERSRANPRAIARRLIRARASPLAPVFDLFTRDRCSLLHRRCS